MPHATSQSPHHKTSPHNHTPLHGFLMLFFVCPSPKTIVSKNVIDPKNKLFIGLGGIIWGYFWENMAAL
jgi:hypothetical protein